MVAAGGGNRFGGEKQFADIGGRRLVDRAVDVARTVSDGVVVVAPHADVTVPGADTVVPGGDTRSESVRAGLAVVPRDAVVTVVHDAARPLASRALFEAVVAAVLNGADGAVPGVAVTDTVKRVVSSPTATVPERSGAGPPATATSDGSGAPSPEQAPLGLRIEETVNREGLVTVQTPQAFRSEALRAAHASGAVGTDDAQLVEAIGGCLVVVPGDPRNVKVTTPADLEVAAVLLEAMGQS